ncbi:zinc finger protein 488 [Brachionichthys hirsutus]|uniref:zinc finger protein 488 n=1 Tax=Brachionichthys hirsutus TaxID=412623 RepID=UPI003604E2F7
MDQTFLPRSIWIGDSKFLQHPADIFTSLVVTRRIPAGTCFGPCALQNAFYDTIAFIAQKSCDKRAKSHVFRVDPEAMRDCALVLSWLRLVQAARNGEEQNTEAFLKAGQLYVRTVRDVGEEEELLVWYDPELSHLLGFTCTSRGSSEEFKCGSCNEPFKNEYPFLAHCRFTCPQVRSVPWSREVYDHKPVEVKRQRRVTDFHNIARDLEHKKSGSSDEAEVSSKRRKSEDMLCPKGRKTVLLEKTNMSNYDNITQLSVSCDAASGDASPSGGKLKAEKIKPADLGRKNEDLAEAREAKGAFTHDRELDVVPRSGARSSAFSLVPSNSRGEQKSAFCKPSKIISAHDPHAHFSTVPSNPCNRLEEMADGFTSRTVMGYSNLMSGDLPAVPSPVAQNHAFHYAPEHWSCRSAGAQLQTASSFTILPPTFTCFGVSVQNWCAKCNLSFRMTSDLVFHMRSHHKKEFAAESQVRRRREEKLTCPICHEYFRERHHLSRHMTSHN